MLFRSSVLVQEGEHGASAAAPIARDVIKAYYDKKSRRTEKQYAVEYRRYEINGEPAAEVPPVGQPGTRPQGPNAAGAER